MNELDKTTTKVPDGRVLMYQLTDMISNANLDNIKAFGVHIDNGEAFLELIQNLLLFINSHTGGGNMSELDKLEQYLKDEGIGYSRTDENADSWGRHQIVVFGQDAEVA